MLGPWLSFCVCVLIQEVFDWVLTFLSSSACFHTLRTLFLVPIRVLVAQHQRGDSSLFLYRLQHGDLSLFLSLLSQTGLLGTFIVCLFLTLLSVCTAKYFLSGDTEAPLLSDAYFCCFLMGVFLCMSCPVLAMPPIIPSLLQPESSFSIALQQCFVNLLYLWVVFDRWVRGVLFLLGVLLLWAPLFCFAALYSFMAKRTCGGDTPLFFFWGLFVFTALSLLCALLKNMCVDPHFGAFKIIVDGPGLLSFVTTCGFTLNPLVHFIGGFLFVVDVFILGFLLYFIRAGVLLFILWGRPPSSRKCSAARVVKLVTALIAAFRGLVYIFCFCFIVFLYVGLVVLSFAFFVALSSHSIIPTEVFGAALYFLTVLAAFY